MFTNGGLDFYLSGGSSNADKSLSVGGSKSSVRVASKASTFTSTAISGVTLVSASGATTGAGELRFNPTGNLFSYKPPGETVFGVDTDVTALGDLAVGDFISVPFVYGEAPEISLSFVFASLPTALTVEDVTIATTLGNLFDTPTADEIKAGDYIWRAIFVENRGTSSKVLRADSTRNDVRIAFVDSIVDVISTDHPDIELLSDVATYTVMPGHSVGLWIAILPNALNSIHPNYETRIDFTSTITPDGLITDEEVSYTGLDLAFANINVGLPDPTFPVPIADADKYQVGTGEYKCDPVDRNPTTVIQNETTIIDVLSVRYSFEIIIGDIVRSFPVYKFTLIRRGCYVTTPERLSVSLPLTDPDREYFRTALAGKARLIMTRSTAVGDFNTELFQANIQSYSLRHTATEISCDIVATRKILYPDPVDRTLVGNIKTRTGDYSDYETDKEMNIAGWQGLLISPQDFINTGTDGIWADLINTRVWETGIETFITQFGR